MEKTTVQCLIKAMKVFSSLSAIALLSASLTLPVSPLFAADAQAAPQSASQAQAAKTPEAAIAQRARRHLARKLRQPVKSVTLVSIKPTSWPDGCLGLGRPGQVCSQALVPGWKIELEDAEQGSWIYRTNKKGDRLVLETPSVEKTSDPLPKNVLFQMNTTGGIAGVQRQVQVMADGRVMEQDLRRTNEPAKLLRKVSSEDLQEFRNRLKSYHVDRYYGQDYKHQGGADLFGHTLTTHQGSVSFEEQAKMPEDMAAIVQAWNLMVQG
ncbi:MAG: hypothetical protein HC860_19895 [Alkalinema sp. RU_4_3]|nr:hypothetical protein [Alkalinema sp. RU_4_3]